jgi:mannose-6-phosphate isomerase-like protein (cupin superfamily)
LTVTDPSGTPISGVKVTSVGPLSRESSTANTGIARLQSVKAGDYRFRFEKEGFITLERDATVKGGSPLSLEIVLNPAPEVPKPPPPEPVAPAAVSAPAGEPKALLIADFAESNRLKGSDPIREDQLGCTASARTELLQIRDSLPEKSQADADEAFYVVAGTGTLRLGNKDVPLEASSLAIVPRGTVRSLTRKGNRPLIVLSVVSGPACTK